MSNRNVAVVLVALLALSALPITAEAQTKARDLRPIKLELDNPVVGLITNVTLTVQNAGSQPWSTAFTAFFGDNGTADANCLARNADAPPGDPGATNPVPPCYQTVATPNIAPGRTATITWRWVVPADKAKRDHGNLTVVVVLENVCTNQDNGCSTGTVISPGFDEDPSDDQQSFPVFLRDPHVHAWPARLPPPPRVAGAASFVNEYWRAVDVTATCKDELEHIEDVPCKVMPGKSVNSLYHVRNDGNYPDTFTASYTMPQVLRDLGYSVTFSPPAKYLNPGESADVVATLLTPPFATANDTVNVDTVNVTATWSSRLNPTITSADPRAETCPADLADARACMPATILPVKIDTKRAYNVTSDMLNNFTFAEVRVPTPVSLTVKNTGNAPDTYRVDVNWDPSRTSINGSWLSSESMPAPRTLQPNEAFTFRPTLLPPANATRGYYFVSFNVTSTANDNKLAPVAWTFMVQLNQTYALDTEIANADQRVLPGNTASFRITVSNRQANGPENLTLVVGNQPAGWAWSLSDTTLSLPAFGSATVYLNTTVPPNIAAGIKAAFFVNVTSQDPVDKPLLRPAMRSVEADVTVLQGPNPDVAPAVTTQFIDPGASVPYRFHLRNLGNEASNFTISVATSSSLWRAELDKTFAVLQPFNGPGGISEDDVTVTLHAPGAVVVGEPESVNVVTLTVTPQSDASRYVQKTVEGRISGPDLVATRIDLNTTTPYGGDPVRVSMRIANNGNRPASQPIVVSLLATDATGASAVVANVSLPATDLRAGGARDVQVLWDTSGLEGAQVLRATVDPAGEIPEIDETNNEATLAVTLRTPNAIRLLAPQEGLSGHAGERILYNAPPNVFQIQYTGGMPSEPVRIEITSEHGWIPTEKSTVNLDLPRLALLPVPVDLTIPTLPGTSTDRLTIRVVPVYRPDAAVSAAVVTHVLDDARPSIASVTVEPATATLGQNVTIYATITDATGLASVRANVITPESDVDSLLMLPLPDGRFAVTQPWLAAGTYRVTLVAADNANPPNVNDTKQVLASFTVNAGSKPAIALAPGQATTIHAGSPVALSITDPLGIAKANYTVGALTYDMGRNYTIDTSNFKSGQVEVTVSAENVYHVASSQKLTFTVDNSPPTIRSLTVNPDAPRKGQDTVLHIEADAKVTSVSVLMKKDGQVLPPVQAVKKSPGVFELTFNPDSGKYEISVVASDAAGNQKTAEVSFTTKSGSLVPGPGVALVALALLGVALLARRR